MYDTTVRTAGKIPRIKVFPTRSAPSSIARFESCMLAAAVRPELVSEARLPANREKNRDLSAKQLPEAV
jgi:hypothetical protein